MAMLNNQRVDDLLVEVFLHSCVKLTNLTEGISYMSNKDLIKVPDLKMIWGLTNNGNPSVWPVVQLYYIYISVAQPKFGE